MSRYLFKEDLPTEWKNLYNKILGKVNREWDSHANFYERYPERIYRSIDENGMLKALTRLLPLAKEWQNDESLHFLLPWQHHGCLDLRLINWEKRTTYAFLSFLPRENAYLVRVFNGNPPTTAHFQRPPLKTLESVPLDEIRSLIQAELEARTIQWKR